MLVKDLQANLFRLEYLASDIKLNLERAIFSPEADMGAASIALDGIVELRDQLADLRIEIAR